MKTLRTFGIAVIVTTFLVSCSAQIDDADGFGLAEDDVDCQVIRAAFDVGSGTTKLKVAKVDWCIQKILDVLLEKETPLAFKENLSADKPRQFNQEILAKAKDVFKELKAEAEQQGATQFSGVATAAFREAENGQAFLTSIQEEVKIRVEIIEQNLEARIGFYGAMPHTDASIENLVVWDIGGGSMQITTLGKDEKFEMFLGNLASVSFRDQIIEKVQKREGAKTPNPLTISQVNRSVELAAAASSQISEQLREKIKAPETEIIGIGGVHYHSVRGQAAKEGMKSFKREDVSVALMKRYMKTDEQIGGDYASTDISNLILVFGFMKALEIEEVKAAKVNLTDGVLIMPDFWQAK